MMTVKELTEDGLRALFCIGITQTFYDEALSELKDIKAALTAAFDDLEGRFGVKVLGTVDDDLLHVTATPAYPYVSYIIAEVPNLEAVIEVTNLVRTPYKEGRISRYISIDVRIGHPLYFANK
jgi:hypothetical protein